MFFFRMVMKALKETESIIPGGGFPEPSHTFHCPVCSVPGTTYGSPASLLLVDMVMELNERPLTTF